MKFGRNPGLAFTCRHILINLPIALVDGRLGRVLTFCIVLGDLLLHPDFFFFDHLPDLAAGPVQQAFADMGHSGGSAMVAIPTINRLLQFENLAPLTTDPEDWIEVGYDLWQNRRCSRMFSEDGGKTYTDVDDREVPKIVHHSAAS